MKKILLALPLAVVALLLGIAMAHDTGRAQPRNQTYVCIADGVNCTEVDEEQSPNTDPVMIARLDVNDNHVPTWVIVGSMCPGITRTDVVANDAVQGTQPTQWQGRKEGDSNIFVFHSDTPAIVTVTYGVLQIGATQYLTADDSPAKIQDGTWRCASRRKGATSSVPAPTGSTGGIFDTVRGWCEHGCSGWIMSALIESNGVTNPNGVKVDGDPSACDRINLPNGATVDIGKGRFAGPGSYMICPPASIRTQ